MTDYKTRLSIVLKSLKAQKKLGIIKKEAKALNIGRTTFSQIVNNSYTKNIRFTLLIEICKRYGINLNYIAGFSRAKYIKKKRYRKKSSKN